MSQIPQALNETLATARALEQDINNTLISYHQTDLLKNLREFYPRIVEFIKINQGALSQFNYFENQADPVDILLRQIVKQFNAIENLISPNSSHSNSHSAFFSTKNSLTKLVEIHLKAIREELNKRPAENLDEDETEQRLFIKSPAQAA